jgi:hypothetical protein
MRKLKATLLVGAVSINISVCTKNVISPLTNMIETFKFFLYTHTFAKYPREKEFSNY